MPERYVAFLSYAHRYQPWVQVLQRNLEAGLGEIVSFTSAANLRSRAVMKRIGI